jgi:hypothetical protein
MPLLERIKVADNKRDVPYRSLIKIWLAEKIREHRRHRPIDVPSGTTSFDAATRHLHLIG